MSRDVHVIGRTVFDVRHVRFHKPPIRALSSLSTPLVNFVHGLAAVMLGAKTLDAVEVIRVAASCEHITKRFDVVEVVPRHAAGNSGALVDGDAQHRDSLLVRALQALPALAVIDPFALAVMGR
jgi:hypothetical protein